MNKFRPQSARIQEIQAELARDHGRDRDIFIGELETVYRRAIEENHFYTAARSGGSHEGQRPCAPHQQAAHRQTKTVDFTR